jgi:transposase
MGWRCALTGGEAERGELERLGRSAARGEADRARAVLWSLDGETSAAVAARLGVRAEQVRRWRSSFRHGGVAGLRSRLRPGRTPRKREAALGVVRDVLAAPVADHPLWTLARLAREIEARTGEAISPSHLSVVLRKGGIAGAGRATPSRAGRPPNPSTAPAFG